MTANLFGKDFMYQSTNFKYFNPMYIDLMLCDDRYKTFYNWPQQIIQTPKILSENGFFYTGCGDEVVCYFCGIKLKQWEFSDDVQKEHLKNSPECVHLKMTYCSDNPS